MSEGEPSPIRWHHHDFGDPEAPPLVCLHGFMGSGQDFEEVGRLAGARFRLVAPDLPGHGRTAASDRAAYSMEACAQALVQWLDQIGLVCPHLWGYSMGGRLALYLALHHADRFDRVILESASPGLVSEEESRARREHDESLARRLGNGTMADFIEYWFQQPLFNTLSRYPERFKLLKEHRLASDPAGLAASLRQMGAGAMPSLWDALPSLSRPTLLIVGEHDTKFTQINRRMQQCSNRFSMRQVEDAGHNVHCEKPQAVADAIVEFLS